MFNIIKYCQQQSNIVSYNKIATSTNNPTISKRMRYAEYIRTATPHTYIPKKKS
jgi:hypothetical protein